MIRVAVYLFMLFFLQAGCSWSGDYPEAMITVKVVDDDGKPVEGAKTGVTFEVPKGLGRGIENLTVVETTDASGKVTIQHKSFMRIGYGVAKEGYYKSNGEFVFTGRDGGRWLPYNPELVVKLRKVVNPVPMYARDSRNSPLSPLKPDQEVGFDLLKYDWVHPYGKGSHADFLFKTSITYNSSEDYSYCLKVSFPGEFDGIQHVKEDLYSGSEFKLPRTAPSDNYQRVLTRCRIKKPGKDVVDDYREDNNYIFRVRSEVKDGKLVRALYGKIHEDIRFAVKQSHETSVLFRYYLNPDYSKNLEFDPRMNLFGDLKELERVRLR